MTGDGTVVVVADDAGSVVVVVVVVGVGTVVVVVGDGALMVRVNVSTASPGGEEWSIAPTVTVYEPESAGTPESTPVWEFSPKPVGSAFDNQE